MPLFFLLAAVSLLGMYAIWWLLYKVPIHRLKRQLIEEGWINHSSCQPHLISNTFIWGDFTLYRSEKAGSDVVFGRLTSRTSKRLFLSFLFPTNASYSYASSSPFVLQRRWLVERKGVIDQFSNLSWYLDEASASLLRPHVSRLNGTCELSLLIEQGIGMVMFTFVRPPAKVDISSLVGIAHEIKASVESSANKSFKADGVPPRP